MIDREGRLHLGVGILVLTILVGTVVRPSAQTPGLALVDRYQAGDFDGAVRALAAPGALTTLLNDLKEHGDAWIDAKGEPERDRRELAAATVAIEAARLGEWNAWKVIRIFGSQGENTQTIWAASPLLIEWGCERFRAHATATPSERLWQLAAMAVAERAEDYEFLVGEEERMPEARPGEERHAPGQHVGHALKRFPKEPRFQLAQGIGEEWHDRAKAVRVFGALQNNLDEGGEATMRLGALALRRHDVDGALTLFKRVETMTRDPWVVYLARYFSGQAWQEKGRDADAIRAYRSALKTIPHVQSASVALASLLFQQDARTEASLIAEAALDATPAPGDPWREYAHADDCFWPELIAALRRDIRK